VRGSPFALIGLGFAVFHPEAHAHGAPASAWPAGLCAEASSRSGGQPVCECPLLVAMIGVPRGQSSLAWASVVGAGGDGAEMTGTGARGRYAQMPPRADGLAPRPSGHAAASRESDRTSRRRAGSRCRALIRAAATSKIKAIRSVSRPTTLLPDRADRGVGSVSPIMPVPVPSWGRAGVMRRRHESANRFGRHRVIWIFDPARCVSRCSLP
jgi:hypothetical protein